MSTELWEKIVLNLLSNAFKFTFEGTIEVSLREEGGNFELMVADTGTGIPASELPRLFERFHRIEGARGRTFEGSGIGLALVHELVKLHGGAIDVASELGRGCSSASIASRAPAGELLRAAASALRWCTNWSSCTAARSMSPASSAAA